MRLFGTLWAASVLFSLVLCAPSEESKAPTKSEDYMGDQYDDDSTTGNEEDDTIQPADERPIVPVKVKTRNMTLVARRGDTAKFPCDVDNAEEAVITWYRDQRIVSVGGTLMDFKGERFSLGGDNASLLLRDVAEEDGEYAYRCEILVDPPIRIVHRLRVVDEPRELLNVIRVKPDRRIEANENDSIEFSCETSIQPPPRIIWSHKGERLRNNEITSEEGNSIRIAKATRHHAGSYQCLADDGSDKPPHDAVEITVRYKPEIQVEREIVHTGTGMKSELACVVHAYPRARVTWQKNQKSIDENDGRKTLKNDKSRYALAIEHTDRHDFGLYSCVAKNQLGKTDRVVRLTGTPSRPRFHGGKTAEDGSTFVLEWRVESYAPITEYKLEYRREGEASWTIVSPRVTDGRGSQFTVEHALARLPPGSYEAELVAKNEFGWSERSAPHTFGEEYGSEEVSNDSAVTTRPLLALTASLLFVVASYETNYPVID